MKFVSKNSNLLIVLSPSLPAQPLAGIPAKSGITVRFKGGVAEVNDPDLAAKMKTHPGFNSDFICADEVGTDPFATYREEEEPVHNIQEIKYGHSEGKKSSPLRKIKVPPEIQKMVNDLAMQKVKELLPGMVEATLKEMSKTAKKEKSDEIKPEE